MHEFLISQTGESFHNVYVYKVTTVYTLNIIQFYISIMLNTSIKLKIFKVKDIVSSLKEFCKD